LAAGLYDYTAAILAYCLRAESVTIWKDVAGLLNAD
jgi:aspartate kinase